MPGDESDKTDMLNSLAPGDFKTLGGGETEKVAPKGNDPPPKPPAPLKPRGNAQRTEEIGFSTNASVDGGTFAATEAVFRALVSLDLLTANEWNAATHAIGAGDDLAAILKQLQSTPGRWATLRDSLSPALTNYQAKQILAGNAATLRLDHYVLLEELGAGGMGAVFLAYNRNLQRLEAIKTILGAERTVDAAATVGLQRFNREAMLLANLQHPHLSMVYHAGRANGVNYLAMEYIPGETFGAKVRADFAKGEPPSVDWLVARIVEIAQALSAAHAAGIIHRDVKSNNIMITPDGRAKLLDLGIARLAQSEQVQQIETGITSHAGGLGTPEVMPPEQWRDAREVTPATDIYSLGCTFYFGLTGKMPFEAKSLRAMMVMHAADPPPKPSAARPDVPPLLDDVIAKMMAKEPEDRYQSCEEFIEALRPLTSPAAEVVAAPPNATNRLLMIAAATALVLALTAVGYVAFVQKTPETIVENAPWRQQALGIARDFEQTHQNFRPEASAFLDELPARAEAIADSGAAESFAADLRNDFAKLAPIAVEKWLERFCAAPANKGVWSSAEARRMFRDALFRGQSLESVRDDPSFQQLQATAQSITANARRPFEKLNFDWIGDPKEKQSAQAIIQIIREVLETGAASPRKHIRLDEEIRVGGMRAAADPPIGTEFDIFLRSDRDSPTVIFSIPGDDAGLVLLQPTVLAKDQWVAVTRDKALDKWEATTPSERYFVYAVSKPPNRANRSFVLEWTSFEKIFTAPLAAQLVRAHLESAEPYPFAERPSGAPGAEWDQHVFPLSRKR